MISLLECGCLGTHIKAMSYNMGVRYRPKQTLAVPGNALFRDQGHLSGEVDESSSNIETLTNDEKILAHRNTPTG